MLDIRDHGGKFAGVSGKLIKNVIRGTSNLGGTATSTVTTISSVDLSKSIVVVTGSRISYSETNARSWDIGVTAKLTSSTSVTFSRNAIIQPVTVVVSWMVIEFESVKNLFNVNTVMTSGQTSKAITTPDMSGTNVLVFMSSYRSSSTFDIQYHVMGVPTVAHNGATSLSFSRMSGSYENTTVECYVVSL